MLYYIRQCLNSSNRYQCILQYFNYYILLLNILRTEELPVGQLPQWKDPGKLMHCTRGLTEHGGLFAVHSLTSVLQAGVLPLVVHPCRNHT